MRAAIGAAQHARSAVGLLTPSGRDSEIAARVLGRHDIPARAFSDMRELVDHLGEGVGVVLVAEEALASGNRTLLLESLRTQPPWSDVPIVILVADGELSGALSPGVRAVVEHGNATLLERPVRVATLVTALNAARRSRARQLDMRDAILHREAATQALRESETRLRASVESAPYPLMLHADDGEILLVSRKWLELTGYSADELTTLDDWITLAYGDRADEARAVVRADLASDRAIGVSTPTWEPDVRTKDGALRRWSFHAAKLGPMADGRELRLVAAVDVTDVRRMLETERSLRAEAEEANRAKMQFLAMMSHELRTPLNAIGGHVQLIELGILGPVNERQADSLARVRRAESHLLGLINDVLNFAKIEAGHVTFTLADLTVGEIFDGIDALIEPQVRTKGLAYSRDSATDEIRVVADLEKVRQVLLNLLSNAIKFTGTGGRIDVTCDTDGDRVLISVTDTGIGVSAQALETIFEPFVQVRPDYTASNEGTGLGLAISRDLALAMHGDLFARSVEDSGSTFTLTLPLAPPA